MAVYGKTWWGKKWLETFTGIDYGNRLSRGRTYANTGRAYDIKINGQKITAKVKGSRPSPYKVEVVLTAFDQKAKDQIRDIISASPTILSSLINKQLPEDLLEKLTTAQIKLFPSNWREIKASCSCPDFAMPCKHIAAVIYLIGAEIDKNPFVVFAIHDCDLLEIISDFSAGNLENVQKILQIEHIAKIPATTEPGAFSPELLEAIDLSKIWDQGENIIAILRAYPAFFDKDFKNILQLAYKHWQKNPTGDYHLYIPIPQKFKKDASNADLSDEEVFSKIWDYPEKWSAFQLAMNDFHQLDAVLNRDEELFESSTSLEKTLVTILCTMPNSVLHKLNPHLRFLHFLGQFALKLVQKSAIMPQVVQHQNHTFVRWIPALFNEEVRSIFDKACAICPQNLLVYNGKILSAQEQVKAALSVILHGCLSGNYPAAIERLFYQPVVQMFFGGRSFAFSDFSQQELASSINQWLSNLYIYERPHKLYLVVEDQDEAFSLDIQVLVDKKIAPIPIEEALKTKDQNTRLTLLSDLSLVTEYIPTLQKTIDNKEQVSFALDDFAPIFLKIIPILKAIGIRIMLPKSLQKILKPALNLSIKAKEKLKNDRKSYLSLDKLLKFNWKIAIGDKKLSVEAFKKLLEESRGLIRFMDSYVLLDDNDIQTLLKQMEKLPDSLNHADAMQAALSGEFNGARVDIDQHLSKLCKDLQNYKPVQLPANLNAVLRPYQERGFSWLVQNIQTGFGSILADDMGLGKTLQVITAILHCKNNHYLDQQRVLIVAPTSLLSNWQKEIEKFAPSLKVHIYHGQNRALFADGDFDVMLTSYGLARTDRKNLNQIRWFLLVIDEAQNIKNPITEQSKAIKAIEARHKIAMSGTPVENRLLEYWSIFDFTNKQYLGTPKIFKDRYATPIERERDQACLERFKKVTSPFILRRLKSDKTIIQDLPEKIETNRYSALTPEQTAIYQEVVNFSIKKIEESDGIERKGLVLQLINSLKQICNHPSQYGKKQKATVDQSGKMEMLLEILREIDERGEKSLIFTQYTGMGEIIAKLMGEEFNSTIPFLHGGLTRTKRDAIVEQFQNASNIRTLIVSLKASGTGLNLTAANHVIHYDLWWNPAVEAQATDRAYRIGQNRNVMVHRFITKGTFEEKIDAMINSKRELANLTVGSGESWITEMSNSELHNLLTLRNAP